MAVRKPLVQIAGLLQELPAGDTVSGVAGVPLFVQDTAPTVVGNYMWVQTNYLIAGDIAFWIEDGLP